MSSQAQADTMFDGATILANARAVAPILRDEADENERRRQLTPRAVEALRSSGVFRMPMPRSWGGPEVDICTQIEVIEELARADGSSGWCAMIGSDSGYFSAALDDSAGRALFPDLDAVTAGFIQPAGRLETVANGYRLSGRWPFASGCTHADVMVAGSVVFSDAAPVTVDGLPEWRIAMLPAERFEILDTWHTTGLAGSGSHDFRIDDAFVPSDYTFRFADRRRDGPLYAWPGLFFANVAGVPLGIARAALDAAQELLAGKLLMPEMRPARDDPRVRTGVAQAEAMVGSARTYVFDVVGEFWAELESGRTPTRRQRAAHAGCHGHAYRSCRDAVRLLADTIGSASIYRLCPIERHLRDLTTLSQHIVTQLKLLEIVGGLWIEGATDHPLVTERIL